jgi:hypothetical protein
VADERAIGAAACSRQFELHWSNDRQLVGKSEQRIVSTERVKRKDMHLSKRNAKRVPVEVSSNSNYCFQRYSTASRTEGSM